MKYAGVIPAKGSSTRLPNKNMYQIQGVPLFLWAANNLNRVLDRKDIFIDSDSDEILLLAEKHGFGAIKRPEALATNATNGNELMLWEMSQVDADVYIQHLPPMIFLKQSTLQKGIEMIESGYDSVFSVLKTQCYLWGETAPKYDLYNLPNSFTLPPTIIEGMGLYFTKRNILEQTKVRVAGNYSMLEIDKFEAIDIDYLEDMELATAVANGLPSENPYTSGIQKLRSDIIE
ncbi:hypothetical protein [Paenibacillus sp. KS-LC4]|uniref:acylneuraminate cytidylyltransferase family protein n=1 Tax=Paenibacillus sp. KS-LC4 TaxID=2979727 RepID=UPI0030CAFE13